MESTRSNDITEQHAGNAPHRGDTRTPTQRRADRNLRAFEALLYALYLLPVLVIGIVTEGSFRFPGPGNLLGAVVMIYVALCLIGSWGTVFAEERDRHDLRHAWIRTVMVLAWLPFAIYHHVTLSLHLEELNSLPHGLAVSDAERTKVPPGELFLSTDGDVQLRLPTGAIAFNDARLSLRQQAALMARTQQWVDDHLVTLKATGALTPAEKQARDIAQYVP